VYSSAVSGTHSVVHPSPHLPEQVLLPLKPLHQPKNFLFKTE
jgi:hypothetical protein